MAPIVNPAQRPYIASHPLALWFAIGIALVGIFALLFPAASADSAAALALPEWLRVLASVFFAVGGLAATLGITRGRPDLEAGGWSLIAAALAVNFIATASIRPAAIGGTIFVLALACGCIHRAVHLSSRGYDGR